jgi:alpha-1,3-mannosyl-glycoprotein beta-1,2-N-acetylglucosaminyltransferase
VLEEDLIVSPDFLSYFHYLLPLLQADKTLLTISAWNDNGIRLYKIHWIV